MKTDRKCCDGTECAKKKIPPTQAGILIRKSVNG
jgi:hypothetical protein